MSMSDQAKHKKDEVAGAAKEKVGEATDNPRQKVEGVAQKDKGRLAQAGKKVKDVVAD